MSDRVIKFRAKQSEGRGWFYGAYIPPEYASYNVGTIYNGYMRVEIDEDTLGQCSGCKDVEGHDIYEDDIIELVDKSDVKCALIVRFGENPGSQWGGKDSYGFFVTFTNVKVNETRRQDFLYWQKKGVRVIGNVFDNPELLEDKR